MIEKILISLHEKYEDIVVVIKESNDLSTLTIQQLVSSLESDEAKKLPIGNNYVESAFNNNLQLKHPQQIKEILREKVHRMCKNNKIKL